jgi:hypothetical protein
LEATHSFKADVNIVETFFDKIPEYSTVDKTATVERKLAIDDLVLFDNTLYYIVNIDDMYIEIELIHSDIKNSRCVLINDAERVENTRTRKEYFAKLIETEIPTDFDNRKPNHEFKVGDKVLLDKISLAVIDDYLKEINSYKVSIIGGGYTLAKKNRLTHA